MKRDVFGDLFKDLLTHLYNPAILETHPIAAGIAFPASGRESRSQHIQQAVFEMIETFRPDGPENSVASPEWRPYWILKKRYMEGDGLQELASFLCIGDRQLRRDQSLAVQALTERFWKKYFQPAPVSEGQLAIERQKFAFQPEPLDLRQVVEGVLKTIHRRLESDGIEFEMAFENALDQVVADRVVLRQVIIQLINDAIMQSGGGKLCLSSKRGDEIVELILTYRVAQGWQARLDVDSVDQSETAAYWCEQLGAKLETDFPQQGKSGNAAVRIAIPCSRQPVILVVDDQVPSLRMFQRYLSRTNFRVVGLEDPTQVMENVRLHNPVLITLDVMMPGVDGWEVLQNLQLDDQARKIPVVVCSAWEEPELAISLGAAAFLKKPVTQIDLVQVLRKLGFVIPEQGNSV